MWWTNPSNLTFSPNNHLYEIRRRRGREQLELLLWEALMVGMINGISKSMCFYFPQDLDGTRDLMGVASSQRPGQTKMGYRPSLLSFNCKPWSLGAGFSQGPLETFGKRLCISLCVCWEWSLYMCVCVQSACGGHRWAMGAFLLQLYTLHVETGPLTGPEVNPSALTTTTTNKNQSPPSPPLPPLPSPPE